MFGDVCKVTLLGNVTKDPELRYTPGGSAVISFGLATNRRYKKGEEWAEEVSFHNIVVWNQAEQLAQRIKKGTRVYIEGRIHTRSWDDKEGKKQYKTEIISEKLILISRFEGDNQSSPMNADVSPADPVSTDDAIDPNDLPF